MIYDEKKVDRKHTHTHTHTHTTPELISQSIAIAHAQICSEIRIVNEKPTPRILRLICFTLRVPSQLQVPRAVPSGDICT